LSDDDGSETAKEDTALQEEEKELGEEEDKIKKVPMLEKRVVTFKTDTIKLCII
jgi:hypothetical protein